jgi:hypothetical protein
VRGKLIGRRFSGKEPAAGIGCKASKTYKSYNTENTKYLTESDADLIYSGLGLIKDRGVLDEII